MPLSLHAHPLSPYCQNGLIGIQEHETPSELRMLGPGPKRELDEHCGS